ncbi:MAG: hypothetical protein ACLGPL_03900 [Acidobacteriota bacterium]
MNKNLDEVLVREIRSARELYERYGKLLLADAEVSTLLDAYRERIDVTNGSMRDGGVYAACTECAEVNPAGCCFVGIEEGYDRVLLLVNLLMGRELPDAREVPGSCFFVGPRGCKLAARFYFCVHYLCDGLLKLLGPSGTKRLNGAVAQELAAGWDVEQAIRRKLKEISACGS